MGWAVAILCAHRAIWVGIMARDITMGMVVSAGMYGAGLVQ